MSLAVRHCEAPHFARSLEWLLFTALEINNDEVVPCKPRWGAVYCAQVFLRAMCCPKGLPRCSAHLPSCLCAGWAGQVQQGTGFWKSFPMTLHNTWRSQAAPRVCLRHCRAQAAMGGSYSQNIGMLEQWASEGRSGPKASGKRRRNTHAGGTSLLHHLNCRAMISSSS